MKILILILITLITSAGLSYVNNREEGITNLRFRLNFYDEGAETQGIADAIKLYNRYSSSFYNTAGFEGLSEIPAAPLLKRRLVKDINMLKGDGLLMVFDRDRADIRNISFINREVAIAYTEEMWLMNLQDMKKRKPVFSIKASVIKGRYLLHKEPLYDKGPKWVIHEVDVYPEDEDIPGLNIKPVI